MQRRNFLKQLSLTGMAAASSSCLCSPSVWASGASIHWRMATSWPKGFPILQTGAERFAQLVEIMSGGRMTIDVYAANEKVNALKVHEAVSKKTVECGHTTAYYWSNEVPATQWFSSVPFGMKAQDVNTWYYSAGGRELWEEAYADHNLLPMLGGNTGIQMGGWFNHEINQPEDFANLRMRIPGLGSQVVARLNAQVVLLPADEIIKALRTDKINAAEWIGPFHDMLMGFPDVAKYYYAPGWQEPGSIVELVFNRSAYEALTPKLQEIIKSAAAQVNHLSFCAFEQQNRQALQKITAERKVRLRLFPHRVLRVLEQLSRDVLQEEAAKNPLSMKIHTAYQRFQKEARQYSLLRGADIRI